MKNIYEIMTSGSYSYLAPLVFVAIIVLGFLIGYWSGHRTAIYFSLGSLVGLVIGVLAVKSIVNKIYDSVDINQKIGDLTLKEVLDQGQYYVWSIFSNAFVIAGMIAIALIQFIVYIFIRRFTFKKVMISNKENGISNTKTRVIGGSISLVSSFIFATLVATYLSVLDTKNNSATVFEKINNVISFGRIRDTATNVQELIKTYHYGDILAQNTKELSSIFGSKDVNPDSVTKLLTDPKTKEALTYLVTDGFVKDNFNLIVKIIPQEQLKNIDLTKTSGDITWLHKANPLDSIKISNDDLRTLSTKIAKALGSSRANPEGVSYFLTASGLLKTS